MITSLPITIKADTKTLQLHSRDVVVCPDLEFEQARGSLYRKRSLSTAEDGVSGERSPMKRTAHTSSTMTDNRHVTSFLPFLLHIQM